MTTELFAVVCLEELLIFFLENLVVFVLLVNFVWFVVTRDGLIR